MILANRKYCYWVEKNSPLGQLENNFLTSLNRSLLFGEILSITFVENQKLELTILRHTRHTTHNSSIRSDEGLTLKISALKLLALFNLRYQLSC